MEQAWFKSIQAWNRNAYVDKYTVNNYLDSTKFLQLHNTAAVHLLNLCKVCMVESSSSSSVVDLLLAPSQATRVDMSEN